MKKVIRIILPVFLSIAGFSDSLRAMEGNRAVEFQADLLQASRNGEIVVSVNKLITGGEFDQMFWAHALTDKKTGFIGNASIMARLIKDGTPYIYAWRNQMIEQLEKKETLPVYLCEKFFGLNKTEVIDKLSKLAAHLVVHLGLQYDEGTGN